MTGEKRCTRCGVSRDVRQFRIFKVLGQDDREYRRAWCISCERAYAREWRERNPGYHARKSREYRQMDV